MPRVKHAVASRKRRKKIFKQAKGYFSGRRKLYRTAKEAVMRAMAYATVGRKLKKRDYRKLWIARVNAACRERGISYSKFIGGLIKAKVSLNRKVLADLAIKDKKAFDCLVDLVNKSVKPKAKAKKK